MKKLMCAVAAVAAGVAMADGIQSANIVGYMGTETTSGGKKMIAPMFLNVSSTTGTFKLSDLKADSSTYDPDEGTAGDLMLTVLTTGGNDAYFTADDGIPELVGKKKQFAWYDIPDDTDPGWYDINGQYLMPADKISFKASQGFWTQGYGVKLITSGQVGLDTVSVTTPSGGKIGCGNPFPMSIKLSNMYADESTYDPDEGTAGDLMLTILTTGGSDAVYTEADGIPEFVGLKKQYAWYDIPDDTEAGWYDINGSIPWSTDKVVFEAGQGFWTQGYGVTLIINAPSTK